MDNVRTTLLEKNVTENNEVSNEFEDVPAAEPEPAEVAAAVRQAIVEQQPAVTQTDLLPCVCSDGQTNLMIDVPNGQKIGRATCSVCGVWGVDFLVPRSQDQNLIGAAASKAWNEAPRG